MRGSPERDISSLRALGPEGGQISRVVHVSTRAAFGVFAEKYGFVQEGHTFLGKVWFRVRGAHCRVVVPQHTHGVRKVLAHIYLTGFGGLGLVGPGLRKGQRLGTGSRPCTFSLSLAGFSSPPS